MPRHRLESIAVARGSDFPVSESHRCARFWRARFQCPFHGKPPEEEEDSDEDPEGEDVQLKLPGARPPPKAPARVPVREPQGIESIKVEPGAEAVPIIEARKTDKVFNAKAEVGTSVRIPSLPDVGPGPPLYIPDENIPSALPPGVPQRVGRSVGPTAEEAFVNFLNDNPNMGASQVGNEGGIPAFGGLAWLFAALFSANAVAHLWQTYNARAGRQPTSFQRARSGTRRGGRGKTPFKAPLRRTVGARRGLYVFKARTFRQGALRSKSPPVDEKSQETEEIGPFTQFKFDQGFNQALRKRVPFNDQIPWI